MHNHLLVWYNILSMTDYNPTASSIVQVACTGILMFLISQLDPDSIYLLAIIFGSLAGSLLFSKFRKEKTIWDSVFQVVSGVVTGMILALTVSEYYSITNWKYLLGISYLSGLSGLILAKSILIVVEEQIQDRLRKLFNTKLGNDSQE